MTTLKVYAETKDSNVEWLGHIPAHWARSGTRRFARSGSGAGFPLHLQGVTGEQYPFYKVNSLARADPDGVIRFSDNTISEATAHSLGAQIFPAGALVLAKIGAALLLGRVRKLEVDACIDNNMLAILGGNGVDLDFLSYQLQTIDFELLVNPGAVPSLSESRLMALDLAWPSLEEQRMIAGFLDREAAEIDAFIADQEKLIGLLAERRAATISHAVTRGIDSNIAQFETNSPWFPTLPAGWKLMAIRFGASLIQTGPFGSQLHSHEYVTEGVPLINPMHIVDGEIRYSSDMTVTPDKARELQRHMLRLGDVIVGRRGELGRSAVVTVDSVGALCGTGSAIIRLISSHFDSRYFQLVFSSSQTRDALLQYSVGSTMDNLNSELVGALRIPKPPICEQRAIVDYVARETDELDAAIADANEVITLSRERRAALISAAVTGKIDVREVGAVA